MTSFFFNAIVVIFTRESSALITLINYDRKSCLRARLLLFLLLLRDEREQ